MIGISSKETLYNLIKEYPKVKEIMISLGFTDILKPGMLNTMGKVMTLEKGARIKDISMEQIVETFHLKGFMLGKEESL